jgi:hypothetical protein
MANITITQLPSAGAITGDELVPIVQNGVTVQTTTSAIAVQPTQTQTFLTATQQPSLANSRYLAAGSGLSLTDNGSQGTLQVDLTGAAQSLNSSSNGIQVKTDANTVTAREITVGTGLTVANGDGVSANPTVSLGSFLSNINTLSASTGIVGVSAGVASSLAVAGVAGQTVVTNGDGSSGNPTVGLATTAVTAGAYTLASMTFDAYGRATTASSASTTGTGNVVLSNSPTLTGVPLAPTAALNTNTTQVATTEYVLQQISSSGGGTVSNVSVVSANGFAGTVANPTSTPAITLTTSINGLLKGNGTAISAATSGTDYAPATSGTSILYGDGAGGFCGACGGGGEDRVVAVCGAGRGAVGCELGGEYAGAAAPGVSGDGNRDDGGAVAGGGGDVV